MEIEQKLLLHTIETLKWALDLIDMYDERLASIDGKEKVYTPTHAQGKGIARQILLTLETDYLQQSIREGE